MIDGSYSPSSNNSPHLTEEDTELAVRNLSRQTDDVPDETADFSHQWIEEVETVSADGCR